MSKQKRRLGRGLGSLVSTAVEVDIPVPEGSSLRELPTESIRPNPTQPRKHFDESTLQSLAESIRSAGIMQPIVVRPDAAGGYQLIAGERRWRAAQLAELDTIPAIVREVDDRTSAEFALIENLQREDLNPIERAEAFSRLIEEFSLTHQQVAERVGLERSNITNHLRLLELDADLRDAVRRRRMSMGQARALLAIPNIEERRAIGLEAIASGWSVREVERRARMIAQRQAGGAPASSPHPAAPGQLHMEDLQKRLGEHLGTQVRIAKGKSKGAGQLIISFYSLDEFDGLLQRLGFDAAAR